MEIRIGSFNMNNFGGSSNKDFGKIAEIIVEENLDVVALQEIFSEGRGVSRLLEQNVKYELYNWDYCFAAPSESRDITKMEDMVVKKTRSEGYAFLWKKSHFKKVEFSKLGETRRFEPRIINSLSKDVCVDCSFFARAPYYIRLQPIHGGFFELRLVNVHIFFGDTKLSSIEKRQAEYAVLTQQIYPEICQNTYGQNRTPYTVAMGDYNLNLFNPLVNTQSKNCYISEVHSYFEGKKRVQILTLQDQLTTLRDVERMKDGEYADRGALANNFDHFTYSPELSKFQSVRYETIDAINKYCDGDSAYYRKNISDHLPIVMTVKI